MGRRHHPPLRAHRRQRVGCPALHRRRVAAAGSARHPRLTHLPRLRDHGPGSTCRLGADRQHPVVHRGQRTRLHDHRGHRGQRLHGGRLGGEQGRGVRPVAVALRAGRAVRQRRVRPVVRWRRRARPPRTSQPAHRHGCGSRGRGLVDGTQHGRGVDHRLSRQRRHQQLRPILRCGRHLRSGHHDSEH